jgi:hypothetical protein
LLDLGALLKKEALEARAKAQASKGTADSDFESGRAFLPITRSISLMQQQAGGLSVALEAVSLSDVGADSDYVTRWWSTLTD